MKAQEELTEEELVFIGPLSISKGEATVSGKR